MHSKLDKMARWTLTIAILAAIALLISLTIYFGGKTHVASPLFVTFAAIGAAASVGWIAITCTECINQHVDKRVAHRNHAVNERIDGIADALDEIRAALGQFSEAVVEYGDQRATAAHLEAIRSLTQTPAPPHRDRVVTRIGRQATRQTS